MRRAATPDGDSLELLLDTICNVFGGIVFIAILVALMTSAKTQAIRDARDQPSSSVTTRIEAQRLQAKIDAVSDALDQLQQTQNVVATPGIEQTLDAIDKARLADLKAKRRIAAMQQWIKRFEQLDATALAKARQHRDAAAGEVQSLRQTLEHKRSKSRIDGRLPQTRVTRKTQVLFLLKGGRIYWVPTRPARQVLGDQREGDVDVEARFDAEIITPNPGGGFTLSGDKPDDNPQLRRIVQAMNPHRQFFDLYVAGDTVDTFGRLKQAIADKGFEYNVTPIPSDHPLVLGSTDTLHTQ